MGLASCCKLEVPCCLRFPSYCHRCVVKHQPPSTASSFLTISAARFLLPPTPTTSPFFDSRLRKSVFPLLLRQILPFAASGGTDKNETTGQEEEEDDDEESSTGSVNAVNTTNSNDGESLGGMVSVVKETVRPESFVIFIACGIGLLTGIAVVLFNNAVGMAATLSGVCQVPLTSVLLLFELTQDYRILLPLLAAVGLSSWVSSSLTERKDVQVNGGPNKSYRKPASDLQPVLYTNDASSYSAMSSAREVVSSDLFELDSSLCLDDVHIEDGELEKVILVAQAMKTRYVSAFLDTPLEEAMSLMLIGKESCAMITDGTNMLIGILTLGDIQRFCSASRMKNPVISDVWESCGGYYPTVWTAAPDMNLSVAQKIMNRHGVNQLPVVSKHPIDHRGCLIGLIDRECIYLVCRVMATKELLTLYPTQESES